MHTLFIPVLWYTLAFCTLILYKFWNSVRSGCSLNFLLHCYCFFWHSFSYNQLNKVITVLFFLGNCCIYTRVQKSRRCFHFWNKSLTPTSSFKSISIQIQHSLYCLVSIVQIQLALKLNVRSIILLSVSIQIQHSMYSSATTHSALYTRNNMCLNIIKQRFMSN